MSFQRIYSDPPLSDMRRWLRAAGDHLPKRLQQANKAIAQEVADLARAKYRRHYVQRSGDGAKSIRALATQTRAQVAIGSAKAPYGPGQNFGSDRIKQFAPKARPDRFLYATIEAERDEIEEMHGEAVDEVMREAFPDGGPL